MVDVSNAFAGARNLEFWRLEKSAEAITLLTLLPNSPGMAHNLADWLFCNNIFYHLPPCYKKTMIASNRIFQLLALAALSYGPVSGFSLNPRIRGGGRAPTSPDKIDHANSELDQPSLSHADQECKLIICQITDVYSLEHLASFKAMVEDVRKKNKGAKVVSMLTGDFLSPYLLSSVDKGAGMMNALNKIPLDYLTWGNHEADIEHKTVCKHVRNFQGTFINSNMLDHEAMESQEEYDVIQLCSPDGKHERKVGLCAVLSDDPALYSHFPAPGAFGGATITDPWNALTKYQDILENEEGCDVVIPLQHLYVPDDHKTCREFDFPVILSGHDHHMVDETVEGTRLIKPGMNAVHAAIVEVSWDNAEAASPKIKSRFARCSDWTADPECAEENERAYDALLPLRNTQLAKVPTKFEPLSSGNARGEVCSMGKYICTLIREALNTNHNEKVDAVLLMGGNIRGNVEQYPEGSFCSLEMLEQETKADEVLGVVAMPGWLLAEGVKHTHSGEPIPGWMQYDDGIEQDEDNNVIQVGGVPIDPNRIYRVATKISDLTNGQCPPWVNYFTRFPHVLPPKGAYANVQSELMSYFARSLWRKLWDHMTDELSETFEDGDEMLCAVDDCPEERLEMLDRSGDGVVTVDDIQSALRDQLGVSVDERETTLAEMVHQQADLTGTGKVTLDDFKQYCNEQSGPIIGEWKNAYDSAAKAFDRALEKVGVDIFEQALQDITENNDQETSRIP